jgi:hypothetical protein
MMPKFKGIGLPPIPSCIFLKDLSVFSLVQMVNGNLVEVTHFPPIHSQEEFGSCLTSVGEKIAPIAETLRLFKKPQTTPHLKEAHL